MLWIYESLNINILRWSDCGGGIVEYWMKPTSRPKQGIHFCGFIFISNVVAKMGSYSFHDFLQTGRCLCCMFFCFRHQLSAWVSKHCRSLRICLFWDALTNPSLEKDITSVSCWYRSSFGPLLACVGFSSCNNCTWWEKTKTHHGRIDFLESCNRM